MTIAGNNPLYGRFNEMVDSLFNPRDRRDPGIIRCADLYCGDGTATLAAFTAGIDPVYAYTLDEDESDRYLDKFRMEPFVGTTGDSVRMAPEFDLLLVQIGEDALTPPKQRKRKVRSYDAPVEHALRFVRVRKPSIILFWGHDLSGDLVQKVALTVAGDVGQLGYSTDARHDADHPSFIVAHLSPGEFPWPEVPTLTNAIETVEAVMSGKLR
ncbi:MAG: hypothetical protein F4X64_14490 [Chloroflexi bacterium]|nr:hypothetical protein [Chloroflexota bacterium]